MENNPPSSSGPQLIWVASYSAQVPQEPELTEGLQQLSDTMVS